MTPQDLQDYLKAQTGIPWTEHHWEQPPPLPYGVFVAESPEMFFAENQSYYHAFAYRLEVYTALRDSALDAKVEAALNRAELPYTMDYAHIESENLYETIFEIEV